MRSINLNPSGSVKWIAFVILLLAFSPGYPQSGNIDSLITCFIIENHIPGCAAMIVKDEKVVYEKYFGYANLHTGQLVGPNTIFMLASVSKVITGSAIMNVQENGGFDLDDSVNAYLPFPVRNPYFPDVPITFRHLMSHVSSIQDDWYVLQPLYITGDSPIPFYDFFYGYLTPGGGYYSGNNYNNWEPETTFQYSNVGAALCGYLTELITTEPFYDYCNDSIFSPLCMDNTSWLLSGLDTTLIARTYYYWNGIYYDFGLYGYPDYPAGQLRTTLISLAKFMQMHMNYGIFDNNRILDSATISNILTVQFPEITINRGLFIRKYPNDTNEVWGHRGSDVGVNTEMVFNMNEKTGVIVLSNGSTSIHPVTELLLDYALTIPEGSGTTLDCNFTSTFPQSFIWTGANGTDWNDSLNWATNAVPDSSNDVIIPHVPNNPVLNPTSVIPAACKNLYILPCAEFTISSGMELTINGKLSISKGIDCPIIQYVILSPGKKSLILEGKLPENDK